MMTISQFWAKFDRTPRGASGISRNAVHVLCAVEAALGPLDVDQRRTVREDYMHAEVGAAGMGPGELSLHERAAIGAALLDLGLIVKDPPAPAPSPLEAAAARVKAARVASDAASKLVFDYNQESRDRLRELQLAADEASRALQNANLALIGLAQGEPSA